MLTLAGACAAPAFAANELSVAFEPVALHQPEPQPAAEPAPVETTLDPRSGGVEFGAAGTSWIGIGFGGATGGDNLDTNLYGRYEYFIAKDISVIGELGVWNFDQEGKDATGFNTSFVLRYHWYNEGPWTLYVDGGIGLLFSTDPVNRSGSDEGTSFNFTPRFGGGVTRAIGDQGARVEVGLRWAHVSNARIGGNNDNPGRDGLMLYAGIILPF
jgi:Lipid A 3-O-deacylase (PagL).